MLKIDILTLFPSMFEGPFDTSMLKKAKDNNLVEIKIHNLRDWAVDKHKTVDGRPFGGGKGMVIRVDIVDRALKELRVKSKNEKVVLLSPQGKTYQQKETQEFSKLEHLILLAGHYEGFDERITQHLVDEVISIGDYILTGGEIPAMAVVDSVVRLIPGVLEEEATSHESFSPTTYMLRPTTLLDYPTFTHPVEYEGWEVPKVLVGGNHKEIDIWRKKQAMVKTKKVRPDLLKNN